jgi:hypothetical protein
VFTTSQWLTIALAVGTVIKETIEDEDNHQ